MGADREIEQGAAAPSPRDAGGRAGDRASRLAFVAHEARNPLSTALWSAELLARMPAAERGGARGEKLAAMCQRALARLRALVEDHFLSERLEAGGLPVRPEPVALAERLADVAARRSASLETQVREDAVAIADPALVDRVFDALLAVAGRGGTPVRVSVRHSGGRIALHLRGAPPPPQGLADPVRGTESDPSGRALALPTARRAAAALGGSLRIEDGAYVLELPAG